MNFSELGLPPSLIGALEKQGIVTPMAVQSEAIPVLSTGKDAYLNSETGSGKTLAYLLPLFDRMDPAQAALQVVVVAPSHELAIQIQRQACLLAQNAGIPIRTVLLIGGTMMQRQIDKLKKHPHLVVGSPGRILDLIRLGKLKMQTVRSVVIDEADRLLGGDSLDPVRSIILAAPDNRQMIFVSATEQPECAAAVGSLAPGCVMVSTAATPVNPNIDHVYLACEDRDKPDLLRKLLHALKPGRAIVFVHQTLSAEHVAAKLAFHHIPVADLHGAFDKTERKNAMDGFRKGEVTVLIASDLAARGLDLPDVTHVFNYDVPTQSKAYLHRVGRTARAGAKGTAVSLMNEQEIRLVKRFQSELSITLTKVRVQNGSVVPVAQS
jgi:superfamily II DNA/RNA helicase